MSMQRESRRLQIQPHNGPADSKVDRKDSTCKQDHSSQGGETQHPGPHLPELGCVTVSMKLVSGALCDCVYELASPFVMNDIWCHIYSLLPMRDAAQVACVSNAFQRFWRCHPNLAFSMKALGMDKRSCGEDEIVRNFTSKVDHILKNRLCMAIKTLEIVFRYYNDQVCNLDSWLQTIITPGIEELTVQLSRKSGRYYNFPWGHTQVQLPLGVALQLKKLVMSFPGAVSYVCADFPSSLQYVEALTICSSHEMIDTPVLPSSKFLHLKYLSVDLSAVVFSPTYDYCSLISFFDASPSLETLVMNVLQVKMLHESIVGDTSHLREMPGHRHDSLKTVKIIGFSSAKSLVELTCHIIENTTSLECLTLDTTRGHPWDSCSSNYTGKCLLLHGDFMVEARKGLLAIRTYVNLMLIKRNPLTRLIRSC
ncbi:hypothetical protein VPH35_098809 [Triticum aestivum]